MLKEVLFVEFDEEGGGAFCFGGCGQDRRAFFMTM